LLIDFVDFVILCLLWWAGLYALLLLQVPTATLQAPYRLWFVVSTFAYLVLLKRYGRTVGYLAAGARLVDLHGRPPSLGPIILRTCLAPFGILLMLMDLAFLSGDPFRQAFRDKLAGTYVIRRSATPTATAPLRYMRYDICCYPFLFKEINPGGTPQWPITPAATA
jgi:uncharacterized RDD family membrane protein YckC